MSELYGNLVEPLSLIDVVSIRPHQYRVRYTYLARGRRRCNGEAIVRTIEQNGLNLIESIKSTTMKRELLLAICTAVVVAIAGEEPTATQERTLWEHNCSIMYLVAKGSLREFYSKEPRPEMLKAGAQPGSLLFRGQSTKGQYSGTAFILTVAAVKYRIK